MVLRVKHLSCKHQKLSLDPQTLYKAEHLACVRNLYAPVADGRQTGESWEFTGRQAWLKQGLTNCFKQE